VAVPVLPTNTEPVSLQRAHPANPGAQSFSSTAAHSPHVEFAPRVPRLPPNKSLVELWQSYNAIIRENTASTHLYSPILRKTVSQQSLPLKTAERSTLPPEPVDRAQEFLPLETASQQSRCLNTGERSKERSQFPPELASQAQEPVPLDMMPASGSATEDTISGCMNSSETLQGLPLQLTVPALPKQEPVVPLRAQPSSQTRLPDDKFPPSKMEPTLHELNAISNQMFTGCSSLPVKPGMARQQFAPLQLFDNIAMLVRERLAV
jgi:hypothetical protein